MLQQTAAAKELAKLVVQAAKAMIVVAAACPVTRATTARLARVIINVTKSIPRIGAIGKSKRNVNNIIQLTVVSGIAVVQLIRRPSCHRRRRLKGLLLRQLLQPKPSAFVRNGTAGIHHIACVPT